MIAVVIPCYKVRQQIGDVISRTITHADKIYIIDDACPESTGKYVEEHFPSSAISVIYHPKNLGVGGAVKTGYSRAMQDGAAIVIKLDGDGQMDPAMIPRLIEPIRNKTADYVKGNRFYDLAYLQKMPVMRKFGNSALSFINKMSSGYWNVMDPTNGFTAITRTALEHLPLDKIDNRFFFESDMLFRLNIIRAVVSDIPMKAEYKNEKSNLRIGKVLFQFPFKYANRLMKRIFYNYFLRDFNVGSMELVISIVLSLFGLIFGLYKWIGSIETGMPATAGTVFLAGLPIILGFQAFFNFLHFDVSNIPRNPVSSEESFPQKN
jgi:glycosyltransferase involved in cell wall biosynthesis